MYLFIFLFVFLFNPLWSDGVTNPVHGLPSDCHQRSLSHYIDSHTTQTVTHHPGLHFPCSIALIGSTWNQSHTHYFTPTQILLKSPSIVCFYCSSSDSTFRSQFLIWVLSSSSSSRSLVTSCFLIISLCWIIPLSCCFGLCLHLAWNITCLLDYPFAQPSGLCSPSFDPRLSLDHSFILPTTYLSAIV